MKRCALLLLLALPAAPAVCDDKKKDDKKGKEAAQAVVADPVKDADAKIAAGDVDGAIGVLEAVAATNGAAALKLGLLREGRGELDLAIDAYKAASGTLSGAPKGEALGRMSVLQDARGMAEAGASAEAALAADPQGVWPTIATARHKIQEGKADEAITLAQKAVAAGGGASAQSELAHAQEAKGDVAAAEATYRQAIAADPKALGPVIGLATVLRRTGRAAEAEPMLAKVIEASPGAIPAYKEMARVKIAQGRAKDAIADANLAAAMAENDPEAKALLTEVKAAGALESLAAGQVDLAVQDLMQLRDANPDSAAVRIALAKAQVARRDVPSAIVELQKATQLDPKNADAQYQLGNLLRMKGDPAAAVAPLQQAAALEPGNSLYATALGGALVNAQQYAPAIDVLTKLTAQPDYKRADGFTSLGWAYVLGPKRYKEALQVLEKATALAPDSADAWAATGWAYFGLKDAAKFKETAGKARTLGYKEANLLEYLKKIEGGMTIK